MSVLARDCHNVFINILTPYRVSISRYPKGRIASNPISILRLRSMSSSAATVNVTFSAFAPTLHGERVDADNPFIDEKFAQALFLIGNCINNWREEDAIPMQLIDEETGLWRCSVDVNLEEARSKKGVQYKYIVKRSK